MRREAPGVLEMQEPELPEVPDADKPVVRNVLYATWALQQASDGSPCVSWQVASKSDGYLISVSFGPSFSIAFSDLRVIQDVNITRIASIVVRNPEKLNEDKIGAVLVIKVLDQQQPIRLSEVEVVRVRKRTRI